MTKKQALLLSIKISVLRRQATIKAIEKISKRK